MGDKMEFRIKNEFCIYFATPFKGEQKKIADIKERLEHDLEKITLDDEVKKIDDENLTIKIQFKALKKIIAKLINEGWHRIIINMQDISYVDSSGTGYLIKIQYELEKYDGELVLSNIRNSVAQILKLMKFDSFIKLIGDLESAKKYLSEKK